jgi:hypothetical protein
MEFALLDIPASIITAVVQQIQLHVMQLMHQDHVLRVYVPMDSFVTMMPLTHNVALMSILLTLSAHVLTKLVQKAIYVLQVEMLATYALMMAVIQTA